MTSITPAHPYGIPALELTAKGRKISFEKECLADVRIVRKVNDAEPELLIERARSPYTDEEQFPEGTRLTYSIDLTHEGQPKSYTLQATV